MALIMLPIIFSVVSSYFVFLRWVFYVNFLLAATITVFVIIPELLTGHWKDSGVGKLRQLSLHRVALCSGEEEDDAHRGDHGIKH